MKKFNIYWLYLIILVVLGGIFFMHDDSQLAELKQSIKCEGGFGHTAVVEDIVTAQGKYESVRLCNLGMRKANDAKHAVTEREIVGEGRGHFILFLSGGENSRLEVRGQRAEVR